jgi:PAS domain S-box-containing protein
MKQSAAEGVMIFNDRDQVVLINTVVNQLLGYNHDELAGLTVGKLAPGNVSKNKRQVKSGKAATMDQPNGAGTPSNGIKKQGVALPVEISLHHFRGGDKPLTAAFMIESADRLKTQKKPKLIEPGPIVFLIMDQAGTILLMNEAGCTLLGADRERIQGQNWFENFLPRRKRQPLQALYRSIFLDGRIENYWAPVLTGKREERTIAWTAAGIYDSAGTPVATLSTGVEVTEINSKRKIDGPLLERIRPLKNQLESGVNEQTLELVNALNKVKSIDKELRRQMQERKAIEEKLAKMDRLHDTMSHNFPDGVICVLNREMRNGLMDGKDLSEIDLTPLGMTGEKSENQKLLFSVGTLVQLRKAFDGESIVCEVKVKDRDYHITAVPLFDTTNAIHEILCVIQNVTERKRMEEGLINALEKEKELGELKSRFVTMASHEFRTPLTTILSSTFLLENYAGQNFEKEKVIHTNRIRRAVNNLTLILNEFLSLEKLEQNKVQVVRSDVNVPEFIQDTLSEMEVVKRDRQVIEYRHAGDRAIARLDHHLLWSIVTNLTSNSFKYSKVGDTIVITSEIERNSVVLTVKDNGIGIPADEQQFIFGRFYRARNASNFEGTGLGLHIIQKYIHLLRGTISFESQLDVGTLFTVILPIGTKESTAAGPLLQL